MRNIFFLFSILIFVSSCSKPNFENKIDSIFSEFNNQTPGASVLVWQSGKIIFKKGYGLASLETKKIIEPKSNFRLASITKQFTAFSILLLEEEGKLSLDDTLPKFFPNFPEYGKDITVKQILQHTSGLLAYEDFLEDTLTVQLKDKDVLEILMERDSTYFEHGTKHRYSNSGYALLAMLIEKLSGKTFAQFLHDRIFVPLKMTNSVAFENGISEVPNRAFGYAKADSGFIDADQSLTSAVLGDGGIYSSTLEMVKWNNEIDNPTLLPKEKLNLAFQKLVLPNGDVVNYGFGWRLDPYRGFERPYHTGGTSGFSNIYMKIPELDLVVIVLINIREYNAKGYAEKISDIFIDFKN
jgi:CubicO group peptidase (beta-lactamase class C family)